MFDTSVVDGLPTANQMRKLHDARRAAWQARRMREASRATITGNIAMGIGVLGTALAYVHSGRSIASSPYAMFGLLAGYLLYFFLTFLWWKRQRDRCVVTVFARCEEQSNRTVALPWKMTVVVLVCYSVLFAGMVGKIFPFPIVSLTAIMENLSLCCLALTVFYFVVRFVAFQFWEDLLFAASVLLAYTPFFLSNWEYTPLCFLSLFFVLLGTASLQTRWTTWTQAIATVGYEQDDGEASA